jgi:hypothetical protein
MAADSTETLNYGKSGSAAFRGIHHFGQANREDGPVTPRS